MKNSSDFEDILREAFTVAMEEKLAELPDESELAKITFSPQFEKRMNRLIAREKRRHSHGFSAISKLGKHVACFLIALFAISFAAFGIRAAADPSFLMETYETFSALVFPQNSSPSRMERWIPTYQPEGFTMSCQTDCEKTYYSLYTDTLGNWFSLEQGVSENSLHYTDTESSYLERFTVNGYPASYTECPGKADIMWSNGSFVFWISSNLAREELLNIATGVAAE